jgi:hypothetical protein
MKGEAMQEIFQQVEYTKQKETIITTVWRLEGSDERMLRIVVYDDAERIKLISTQMLIPIPRLKGDNNG